MNYCNGDCKQGRTCDCGDPYPTLWAWIFVVAVMFLASCFYYLVKTWP